MLFVGSLVLFGSSKIRFLWIYAKMIAGNLASRISCCTDPSYDQEEAYDPDFNPDQDYGRQLGVMSLPTI